jgi:pathogenesis-related protein 1
MQRMLDAHNRGRAEHCAAPLQWSPQIAAVAQRWADTLAQRGCPLEHSSGSLGENLAAGSASLMSPEQAFGMWIEERRGYDFSRGGFSMDTGHFTQVVWKSTRMLGCATATCGGNRVWVCNYDPPGNMEGGYGQNVGTGCR